MNKENDEDYLCVTQDLGYDGNRDRWVGYDPNNFDHIYREYEKIVDEQKKRKAEKLKKKYEKQSIKKKKEENEENEDEEEGGDAEDSELSSDSEKDNDLNDNKQNNKKNNKNEKNKTIARNLRIREDTAKYLYNLNLNSAFYDPKSRSMREDPLANIKNNLENSNYYKGENYYNNTGDAIESKKLEIFAWESYKRGENVHFNAQPTQLELMYKEFLEKKNKLIKKKQEDILKTYKCENITKENNNQQELIHSEVYTEYKPVDQIDSKKNNKIKILSKYEEDIYISDHTSIFGSYYDRETKKWGYKCCKCTDKFQHCVQS
ncbi:pre-mRNA-splicing factor SLU7 [Plasmodium yoelii yoelii]|nr:pre-mRNA-splicing factor SLU7 [Plasmodium yoelii yoelii]